MGWWANPLNSPTRGGLSWVTKFLTHQKVSRVGFAHFEPGSWWANPCEPDWLILTCLFLRYIFIILPLCHQIWIVYTYTKKTLVFHIKAWTYSILIKQINFVGISQMHPHPIFGSNNKMIATLAYLITTLPQHDFNNIIKNNKMLYYKKRILKKLGTKMLHSISGIFYTFSF